MRMLAVGKAVYKKPQVHSPAISSPQFLSGGRCFWAWIETFLVPQGCSSSRQRHMTLRRGTGVRVKHTWRVSSCRLRLNENGGSP